MTLIISLVIVGIIILLLAGAKLKPIRFIGQSAAKLGVGVLLIFFLNVFGGAIGLHIPINLFTAVISGFLGIFGLASLAAVHLFVM